MSHLISVCDHCHTECGGHCMGCRTNRNPFVFETGSFHPAKKKEFETLAEVWGFVTSLRDTGKLADVVCCDESGEILDPPYHNEQTPGLIEEKIDGFDQPRMWLLQIR